jgi:hypothetical protein
MDQEFELGRAKWLGLFLLLLLVSCFISYEEVIYLIRGKNVQAKITDVTLETTKRLGITTGERVLVDYEFTEADGTHRTGRDFRSKDWEIPANEMVAIRYTPGVNGTSRFVGHVNWLGLGFFIFALASVGWFGYKLWREAKEAYEPRKRKKA